MKIPDRKRILISAYACSPYRGSEPGVGWGFISILCERYDLDVIVEEEKFRTDIEMWLSKNPSHPAANIRFHFIRKQRNRWLRKIWPPSYYWYYRRWQAAATKLALSLDQDRDFALVHQLTMVGFREPGYLWKLDKPFVWGPIGGAGNFPWRFLLSVGFKGGIYYLAYNLINSLQLRFGVRPRHAANKAGIGLLSATYENYEAALRYWKCSSTTMPEIGLYNEEGKEIVLRELGEPLRIVWSGQFTSGKALNLALEALSELPNELDWEFHILGNGDNAVKLGRLANRLGIGERCQFHGWMDRTQALALVAKMHLSVITSLRDLTSTVVIEALEAGLPVIAPAHCGFSDAITHNCGILVPIKNPAVFRTGIARAISKLAGDEVLRQQLASGALVRSQKYNWHRKVAHLAEIYEGRIAEDRALSDRFMP